VRNLTKLEIPEILATNVELWTAEYQANPGNPTGRYRYRHAEIKARLIEETSSKCVYCESKIGHNTPGDVEHKIPSSVQANAHFNWANLTIACTECNRRKLDYYDVLKPFLDPYVDDVEEVLIHHGPIVSWRNGEVAAEISIRTLELHNSNRQQLLMRKIEKIDEINVLCGRILESQGTPLENLLRLELERRSASDAEYSAMVTSLLDQANWE
jgi:hypothetical protein